MSQQSQLELLRAALGRGPTDMLMWLASWGGSVGSRSLTPRITPRIVHVRARQIRKCRLRLEAAGLIRTTYLRGRGYEYEIIRREDLPMIHLPLDWWRKLAYERSAAAAYHSACPTTDQYRDLDLESLRARLGRGPADLLVWLVLLVGATPHHYLCSNAEPWLVGPITADCLRQHVGCNKACLYAWRRKLQALGLLSVADQGSGGCTYKVLVTGDPYVAFERCVKQSCDEETQAGSCEPLLDPERVGSR